MASRVGVLVMVALLAVGVGCRSEVGRSRASIVRADRLSTMPSTQPVARPAEWGMFERRTYLDGQGGRLPFRVLYPEGYDPAQRQRYPLVLFLHGAGERGEDNDIQLTHGWRQFVSPENRRRFPAIVVFPQCPKGESWATLTLPPRRPDGTRDMNTPFPSMLPEQGRIGRMVVGLLDELARTERVDASRVYVMGLSMGGMGTFDLISRYPDRFAAAVPICGGGDIDQTRRYKRKVALWIAHGDADPVVPVKWSRDIVKALELQDVPVLYTEFPGVGHDSWTPMFDKAELLPWLFSQRKDQRGWATSRPVGEVARKR